MKHKFLKIHNFLNKIKKKIKKKNKEQLTSLEDELNFSLWMALANTFNQRICSAWLTAAK